MHIHRVRRILLFIPLLFVFFSAALIHTHADEIQSEEGKKERNFRATPFAAPGYTPELGFLITAGGLFSFSTKPASENLNRSNFSATLGYGTNGAVIGCSLWNTYWLHDRIRVNLELWFKDMSDHYWGVGYENARNTPKGDSTTAYQRLWWQIMPELHYQVYPDLYLGMKFDFNRTVFSDMSPGVANDPNVLNYDTDNFNSGVGLILMYDSRDMPENSYSGWLLRDSATIYDEVLGSNNAYQIFEVDYRQYQQILRPGSTLAWQVYSRIGTGQVPYAEVT